MPDVEIGLSEPTKQCLKEKRLDRLQGYSLTIMMQQLYVCEE